MTTERASRPPLVLIPGIQGRWQWVGPTAAALGANHRLLTFSLTDVQGGGIFERWALHIDALLDRVAAGPVPMVGLSFGGLVAIYYAASRPGRVSALVLASVPSPTYQLDPRRARYLARPRLSFPFFAANTMRDVGPELMSGLPNWRARARFAAGVVGRTLRWPSSPSSMADWIHQWKATDLLAAAQSVRVPTLVLTGEPNLDRVVPVRSSLEYLDLIPGTQHRVLERTGHLGFLTRPLAFADEVTRYLDTTISKT